MVLNRIVILCGGVLTAGLLHGVLSGIPDGFLSRGSRVHAAGKQATAQPAATPPALYSAEQAKRGAELYKPQCAQCHGADLGGVAASPPLSGDNFLSVYTNQSVLVLFDKVQKSMPQSDPGSLTPAQTADLLAYMLSVNKYAAGEAELPPDRDKLKTIQLPKPAK